MLKQHATFYRRSVIAVDVLIAGACFFLAYYASLFSTSLASLEHYLWILPVVAIMWGVLLYFSGIYDSFRMKGLGEIIYLVWRAGLVGFLIFGSITFAFKITGVSRVFVTQIFALSTYFIILEKVIIIVIFRQLRRQGLNFRNLLVVGTGSRAQKFVREIDLHREFGLKVAGLIDDEHDGRPAEVHGYPVIGCIKDIPEIIRVRAIDIVVFVVPRTWLGKIEEAILYCETVGVSASVAVDLFDLKFSTGRESHLFGFPLLTFERTSHKLYELLLKRIFDFVISGVALILLSPLFLVISILIKATSSGPVFFRQKRCGLNGRIFTLYKFRTMEADAEAKLESLLQHNEMAGPVFKMANDPRVTKVGRFLRKSSLDEIPQLWNVFKGTMSLVGPRPPIPKEVAQYDHWQRRRLSMRPGITCLWQISGRNNIKDFNKWMKLDLDYIDRWSFWWDLVILFKTIPVVLIARGAK